MTNEGLFGKYLLKKADGSSLASEARYFVLRYDAGAAHGDVGRSALGHYCGAIRPAMPDLADELESAIAAEGGSSAWLPMTAAPKDGSLILLLIEGGDNRTEDAERWPTIGANSLENTGEDLWQFAGWSWCSDEFTQGDGRPIGWLPLTTAREARQP